MADEAVFRGLGSCVRQRGHGIRRISGGAREIVLAGMLKADGPRQENEDGNPRGDTPKGGEPEH